jgi:lipopolysaccharide export system permease protein
MRLDRLVWREVIPMWFFGAMMFTVLLMSGQFLFELTKLFSEGAQPGAVLELIGLLIPGILVKCMPMGMLLGTLLSFGRLSGDSEVVALRAAGASVERMMRPVFLLGLGVSLATFLVGELFVPPASKRALELRAAMEKNLHSTSRQPTNVALVEAGRVVGYVCAADTDLINRTLRDVTVVSLSKAGKVTTVLSCQKLRYRGLRDWEVIGEARLYDLVSHSELNLPDGAWPANLGVKPPETMDDLITKTLADLDVFSMGDTAHQIAKLEQDPTADPSRIANLRFGFWNHVAIPLSALVFGLLGAPLGIRNHRTGAATGFALSIAIIFGYMMVVNFMNIFNQGGRIPAWVASFTPVVVGFAAAVWLIHKRNVQ